LAAPLALPPTFNPSWVVVAADLDGDNRPDAFVSHNFRSAQADVWLNHASWVFDAPMTAIPSSLSVPVGTPFTATVGTFVDPNGIGALTDFTADINWGDGHSSVGVLKAAKAQGGFIVTGDHTYTLAAQFSITVTVQSTTGTSTATASSTAVATAGPLIFDGT